jgi:hypothetical protein
MRTAVTHVAYKAVTAAIKVAAGGVVGAETVLLVTA